MQYKSPVRIGEHVLKDALFSVVNKSLLIEHPDIASLTLQPEMLVQFEIVKLRDYKEVRVVAVTAGSVQIDLWGEPEIKERQPKPGARKVGRPRKIPALAE